MSQPEIAAAASNTRQVVSADDLADVRARLDALRRESDERRRELRAIADELPAALSRRVVVVDMMRNARASGDPVDIAKRFIRKLLRAPKALVRRLRAA